MSDISPIAPLKMPDVTPATPGPRPEFAWLPVSALVVDRRYQREISERSVKMIRRIVSTFDWSRVRPATVARREDGLFEVIDGQHLATAIASHPGLDEVPCLITTPADRAERARAFVGVNRDRVAMTPLQIFKADLEAGDAVALATDAGVTEGGGRILRSPPVNGRYGVGDTVAIGALRRVAERKGKAGTARLVRICVAARMAPIPARLVQAVEALLWSHDYAGEISDTQISTAILRRGFSQLDAEAAASKEATGDTLWRALTIAIWRAAE
jgi:hypothetical protein